MTQNSPSLVKYLIEDRSLRNWARKTIIKNGGTRQEAENYFIEACQLLWERLDQGMEIRQPEAFVRMILLKTWRDGKQVVANQPALQLAGAISERSNTHTPFQFTEQNSYTEDKMELISTWFNHVKKQERNRRIIKIVAIITTLVTTAGTTFYFFQDAILAALNF